MRKIFWIPAVIVSLFARWVVAGSPAPNTIDVHPEAASFPWLRDRGDFVGQGDAGFSGSVQIGGALQVSANHVLCAPTASCAPGGVVSGVFAMPAGLVCSCSLLTACVAVDAGSPNPLTLSYDAGGSIQVTLGCADAGYSCTCL
jgi:hypothetical protein